MFGELENLKEMIALQTVLQIAFPALLLVGAVLLRRKHRGVQTVIQIIGAAVLLATNLVSRGLLHYYFSGDSGVTIAQFQSLAQNTSMATFAAVVIFAAGYVPCLVRFARARHVSILLVAFQLIPILGILGLRITYIVMAQTATVQTLSYLTTVLVSNYVYEIVYLVFGSGFLAMAVRLPKISRV